jgi:PGF-CTERM protein
MSGNAVEESTETNAPGFGVGVAIVATLGTALLVTRRQD